MGEGQSFADLALQQHIPSPQAWGCHAGAVLHEATRWRRGSRLGGQEKLQVAPARGSALLSHHLALGVGCGQWLGSLWWGADGGAGVGFQPPGRALMAVC